MKRSILFLQGMLITHALALEGLPPDFVRPAYLRSAPIPTPEESSSLYEQGEHARALPGLLAHYHELRRQENDENARPSSDMQVALLFLGSSFAALGDYAQGETALLWYREISERRWSIFDRRGGLQPAMWLAEFYDHIGNFDKSRQLRTYAFGIHYVLDWDDPDSSAKAEAVKEPKPFNEAVQLLKKDVQEFAGNEQIRGFELFIEIVDDRIRRGSDTEAAAAGRLLDEVMALIPDDEISRPQSYKGMLVQARHLIRRGEPDAAIRLIEKAVTLLTDDERGPSGTRTLLLAEAALRAGRPAEARRHLEGMPSPMARADQDAAQELETSLLLEEGDVAALRASQQAYEQTQAAQSKEVLAISSEEQRIRHFKSLKPHSIPLKLGDAMVMARNALRYKGIVLDSILQDARARQRSRDVATSALENDLQRARQEAHRLLRVSESMEIEQSQRRAAAAGYRAALAEVDRLESRLARQASGYGLVREALDRTPQELLDKLPDGACLLDFVVAQKYAGRHRYEPVYAMVRYWNGQVSLRVCDDFSGINASITTLQEAMRQDAPAEGTVRAALSALYRSLIGDSLDGMPQDTRLLVSPDGMLNFIPFAALLQEDGQMLVQRFQLAFLASARDALQLPQETRILSALLVGDPDYQRAASGSYMQIERGSYAARGIAMAQARGFSIELPPLPGTREEVRMVEGILRGHGVTVNTLMGIEASESSLRRSADNTLVHIATHGIVLDSGQDDTFSPMTSGVIALAGAQRTLNQWQQGLVGDTSADGVVTAGEFAEMNLKGVETLVLSACETGLGKAEQGEGVMGLRRGLHQGGVKQLLLTLWPIEDQATVEMMQGFYQQMIDQERPVAEALALTQRAAVTRWIQQRGLGGAVRVAAPFVLSLGACVTESAGLLSAAPQPSQFAPPVISTAGGSTSSSTAATALPGERFPQTRQRLLDESTISEWSDAEIRYALNEMFARHGATFEKTPEIQRHFDSMSWYQRREGVSFDGIEAYFNAYERQNILTIGSVRNKRKASR